MGGMTRYFTILSISGIVAQGGMETMFALGGKEIGDGGNDLLRLFIQRLVVGGGEFEQVTVREFAGGETGFIGGDGGIAAADDDKGGMVDGGEMGMQVLAGDALEGIGGGLPRGALEVDEDTLGGFFVQIPMGGAGEDGAEDVLRQHPEGFGTREGEVCPVGGEQTVEFEGVTEASGDDGRDEHEAFHESGIFRREFEGEHAAHGMTDDEAGAQAIVVTEFEQHVLVMIDLDDFITEGAGRLTEAVKIHRPETRLMLKVAGEA